jgi:hypothetical protein
LARVNDWQTLDIRQLPYLENAAAQAAQAAQAPGLLHSDDVARLQLADPADLSADLNAAPDGANDVTISCA